MREGGRYVYIEKHKCFLGGPSTVERVFVIAKKFTGVFWKDWGRGGGSIVEI